MGCQVKEAGWWLVLGDEGTQELHALKRVSFSDRASARLSFTAGTAASAASLPDLHLYLVRLNPLQIYTWTCTA